VEKFTFSPMACHECGATISPVPSNAKIGAAPKGAIYVCECGFRYSNARDPAQRTAFAPTPELNVPEPYRKELLATLAAAANVSNRPSKRSKFTYSTSEDAVTWTIFRWLEEAEALAVLAETAERRLGDAPAEILYWGAPVGGGATELSSQLREVSLSVDGSPDRLTEPDVVIAWPGDIVFVEVKYRAKNDQQSGYPHFNRYTTGCAATGLFAVSPTEVAAHGWYELTRNWRIGTSLAATRRSRFTLVNLGPRQRGKEAAAFAATISQTTERKFAFVRWAALLERARQRVPPPPELDEFIAKRQLEGRWS
jgi:hypothetical protein